MTSVELLGVPISMDGRVDVYSGVQRNSGKIWGALHRADRPSRTAVIVTHPASNFLGHYLLEPLAARGVDAIGLTTRYLGNDSALIMENCAVDLGAAIKLLRDRGYEWIVLVGNSGGGGLSAFYQSQAESPTVTRTPAGDTPDLTQAGLLPADALVELMAHPGRALVLAEWIDPAIRDEQNPALRDPALDLFSGAIRPPYSDEFIALYRAAQLGRIRRISDWVKQQLVDLDASAGSATDLPFVVHGTAADPRFLDLTLDPSDREPGTMWGPAAEANYMPASLGHYSSLRSWLSQWSIDDTNANGPAALTRTSVPTIVIYGTADQVCFPSQATSLYEAVPHDDRHLLAVKGGTHYLHGQPELMGEVADMIVNWLADRGMR